MLCTFVCASCAEAWSVVKQSDVPFIDIDLKLLKWLDRHYKDRKLVDLHCIDSGCVPPPCELPFPELRDILLLPVGSIASVGCVSALMLCHACQRGLSQRGGLPNFRS